MLKNPCYLLYDVQTYKKKSRKILISLIYKMILVSLKKIKYFKVFLVKKNIFKLILKRENVLSVSGKDKMF